MKTCPYCAEQIHAAALVCKHCRHNLVPLRARASWRWARRGLLAAGLFLSVSFVFFYFSEDHQAYLAFVAERKAWDQNCGSPVGPEEVTQGRQACADELLAMIAEATRHGWVK